MISVVVTSYNTRHHLRRCLETLQAQSAAWGEVLVVDNASSDGSPEMVASHFPSVRLLHLEENVGFGGANNRGAAAAEGDQLLLLNSDAWLADGALELLARRLDKEPRLALVAPQLYYPDGGLQFVWVPETGVVGEALQMLRNRFESRRANHRLVPALIRAVLGPGWYTAACVLVRRSAFEEVGGFDEERFFLYFEDVDLSRRLRQAGWQLAAVPEATAYHVKGGSSSRFKEVAYRRSQLIYYEKHRPAWENRVLRRRLRSKLPSYEDPWLRSQIAALLETPVATPE